MKRYLALVVVLLLAFVACKKNTASKIPKIRFQDMWPDTVRAGNGFDTVSITFFLTDGDADLGNDPTGTNYDIYVRDSRVDTFHGIFFPSIIPDAEDASKGVEGYCTFQELGAFLLPRADSIHQHTGDTLHYEIYIKDKAGNESNHITTPDVHIVPQ